MFFFGKQEKRKKTERLSIQGFFQLLCPIEQAKRTTRRIYGYHSPEERKKTRERNQFIPPPKKKYRQII